MDLDRHAYALDTRASGGLVPVVPALALAAAEVMVFERERP